MSGDAGNRRPAGIRIATRYTSIGEFIAQVARLTDETSIFVPMPKPPWPGTELRFVFQLADRSVALEGRGKVVETHLCRDRPMDPTGFRLRFVELTSAGREIHRALLAAKARAAAPSRPRAAPTPVQAVAPPGIAYRGQRTPPAPTRPPPIPRAATRSSPPPLPRALTYSSPPPLPRALTYSSPPPLPSPRTAAQGPAPLPPRETRRRELPPPFPSIRAQNRPRLPAATRRLSTAG